MEEPKQKPTFFSRLKKGYGKVQELKEKYEANRQASALKKAEKAKAYTQQYKQEAMMYRAAAERKRAQHQYYSPMGSGWGSGNPFMQQQPKPPKQKVVYINRTKKQTKKVIYRQPNQSKPKGMVGLDYL